MQTPEQRIAALEIALAALLHQHSREDLDHGLGFLENVRKNGLTEPERQAADQATVFFNDAIGSYEEHDELAEASPPAWPNPRAQPLDLPPNTGEATDIVLEKILLQPHSPRRLVDFAVLLESNVRFARLVRNTRQRNAIVAEIRRRAAGEAGARAGSGLEETD